MKVINRREGIKRYSNDLNLMSVANEKIAAVSNTQSSMKLKRIFSNRQFT